MGICELLLLLLLASATLSSNFFRCSISPVCICDEDGYLVYCQTTFKEVKRSQSRKGFSGRIVGGTDVDILKHPYMLGLENDGRLFCGATIISPKWAVTAGHCVTVKSLPNLQLRALSDKLERGGHTFDITGYIPHPEYDDDTQENDIALLQVEKSFLEVDSRLTPIKLPQPNEELPVGTKVTVIGWGHTFENGKKSDQLKHVTIPITTLEYCNSKFDYEISSTLMICAGPKKGAKDACQADSGGPLVYNNTLYGIVSFGKGCGTSGVPGVYTKVSALRQWIQEMAGV